MRNVIAVSKLLTLCVAFGYLFTTYCASPEIPSIPAMLYVVDVQQYDESTDAVTMKCIGCGSEERLTFKTEKGRFKKGQLLDIYIKPSPIAPPPMLKPNNLFTQ